MKLACANVMVPQITLTEKAEYIRSLGFEGISVFEDYDSWTDKKMQEILELDKRTGVKPCEFVFSSTQYGHLMDKDATVRCQARNMYKEAAAICKDIGAITEFEYEYGPQDPLPLFHPYGRMAAAEEERFLELYQELLEVVNGTSGAVLIETINRYESPYLNSVSDCCDIVQKVANAQAGVLLDFFHAAIEEADMPGSVKRAGSLIKHVHLGDNNRLLPGQGSTDWKSCIGALKAIGYKGFLTMECGGGDSPEALKASVQYLQQYM